MNESPPASNLQPADPTAALRRGVYALLIAISIGAMVGRILAVNKANESAANARPFLSANDVSRWATVRALVEHGTYSIDDVILEPNWDTIDKVRHVGSDGQLHFYSSKPPLLTTLVAGEYWVIHRLTGWTLGDHPYELDRFLLLTLNVLPLLIYFLLLARLFEQYGRTDWGRLLVMAAATMGTFLTTFAVVFNNHLTAAVTVLAAVYPAIQIWYGGRREWRYFAIAGFFAALTAADELPALSLFAMLGAGLLWKAPRQTLVAFLPAALVVAAGFFATNYLAHGSLRPPYAHRGGGGADDWYVWEPIKTKNTKGKAIEIKSHWADPHGIDKGETSTSWYAFNALMGHHGIFSLTPFWLLAVPGLLMLGWGRGYRMRDLALLIGGVTVVCLTFYLFLLSPRDRNYGGMTSGFRWVFWMTPLWLLAALPAADWLAAARWRRGVGYVLLGLSVLSASYPVWTPFTHPWITNFFLYMGWESF